ncbi:DUF4384 domain-containing protein (plasmid) [Azospirillum sp. TSA2s]|uniref:caspase family protein n=1 Tax=Azospirillum sp. TSA2s TaxID=709810 RepID=UPI0010AA0352|nr:caspase family protein [Azospirillum sp. TSA2s]QCG93090.1 DUF4384 domain-containing protein [Azospirillum sp. TSA2s]
MNVLTTAALGLAVFTGTLATGTAPALAEKHALIVSINEYAKDPWKLRGAVNDGKNIERLLRGPLGYRPDQIKELFDQAATRDAILSNFRSWLIDATKPGDEVFFYFSGHGYQQPDTNGDEEDGLDETLVAADAEPDGKGGVRNMIIDDEMELLLDALKDRKVTVVIDSCHSGTISRGAFNEIEGARSLPLIPEIDRPQPISSRALALHRAETTFVAQVPGRMVWTAVAPYQKALEESRSNPVAGVFTTRFVRGIIDKKADANGDGIVTNAELYAYVQKESDVYCKSLQACQAGLTPTLEAPTAQLPLPVTGGEALDAAPSASPSAGPATTPLSEPTLPPASLQNTATALLANDNQGGVQVEVLPSGPIRVGQAVRFRVTSQVEGSLVLLDANAAGELIQLFPNEHSQAQNRSNRIYANRPLTVPDSTYGFEFTASEPAGQGKLIALVLQDPIDLSVQVSQHRDLNPVAKPVDYMAQIAERLRRPWTQGATTRMTRWSMTSMTYTITR